LVGETERHSQILPFNMFSRAFILGLSLISLVSCVSQDGDDPLDWLRDSLPGEPGVDYPILASVQESSFSCSGLVYGGYYADPEQDCQAYHVCLSDPLDQDTLYPVSFLCPNGTIFNQQIFVCDWWFNVDCGAAASLYGAVEGAFGSAGGAGGEGEGDAGTCPAPGGASEEECAGAVSNCWSPGQRDTDCPNNGLCCFDGCADTCVDGPKPTPAPYEPPVEPVISESETENKPDYQPPPTPVTEGYEYPVPEVPLEFPKPQPPPPELPTLYGPPDI